MIAFIKYLFIAIALGLLFITILKFQNKTTNQIKKDDIKFEKQWDNFNKEFDNLFKDDENFSKGKEK